MHQIRFRPGLRPRPHTGGAHRVLPDPKADFKGFYFLGKGGGGRTGAGSEGMVFSLYLSIPWLRKGHAKFLMGVLESPGKVLDFISSVKEWEPCVTCGH